MTLDNVSKSALAESTELNRLAIDHRAVDAWSVVVGRGDLQKEPVLLELRFGLIFLRFELEESGVEILRDDLRLTVEKSLEDHGASAMHGYLGMLRGDYRSEQSARKSGLRLLPWFRPPSPKWAWCSWESVEEFEDKGTLVMTGTCRAV